MGTESDFIIANGYYEPLIWAWISLGIITFFYLFYQPAPYGRHQTKGWGPEIPSWLGWIIMECPSPILLSVFLYLGGPPIGSIGTLVLYGLWMIHYIHRAFIQPLMNPGGNRPMPLVVCGSAVFCNLMNGYINGRGLCLYSRNYGYDWLSRPSTIVGLLLFATGFIINRQADAILLGLRKPGETQYKIPYGGLYRYISCPNYFGEIVEWIGFAIAAWSLPSFSFALWTISNLAPRAVLHHKWYQGKFPGEYPKDRNALIPNFFSKRDHQHKA